MCFLTFSYTMYVLVTVKVSVYMLYLNVCFSFTCLPLAWAGQSRSTTPQARQELVSETRAVSAGSAHLHTESAASVWPGRTDLCQTSSEPVPHTITHSLIWVQ